MPSFFCSSALCSPVAKKGTFKRSAQKDEAEHEGEQSECNDAGRLPVNGDKATPTPTPSVIGSEQRNRGWKPPRGSVDEKCRANYKVAPKADNDPSQCGFVSTASSFAAYGTATVSWSSVQAMNIHISE